MSKAEQVRPLAMPSPDPVNLEEGNRHGDDGPKWQGALRNRRCLLCCLGCSALLLVLLALAVLVFAIVFHVKNPILTMNSLHVVGLSRVNNASLFSPSPSVDVTLTADISMRNPNNAPFSFGNSTVEFRDSHRRVVGVAATRAGKVGTDRSLRFNLTVIVHTTSDVANSRAGSNGTTSVVELTSYLEIEGTVNVLGTCKRRKVITLNCSLAVDTSVSDQLIKNPDCSSKKSEVRSG